MTTTVQRMGTIDWVDLNTKDVEASRAFYATVLGWTYETSETPMGAYHVAFAEGHQAAGMMQAESEASPSMWTVFVRVASVDETISVVTNAGGLVLSPPIEIPGGARVAVVSDPAGAVFALISGGPEPGPDEPPLRRTDAGAVAWCELMSRDPHAAIGFYDAVFGWEAALDASSGYTMLRLHGADIGGLLPMPADMDPEVSSSWTVYFGVADVSAAVAAVIAASGSVLKDRTEAGDITFAVLADPTGAAFGVLTKADGG